MSKDVNETNDSKPVEESDAGMHSKAEALIPVITVGHIHISLECKIECVKPNPKRTDSQSWKRYEKYQSATTVAEYLELGGLKADLKYDYLHGYMLPKERIVNNEKVPFEAPKREQKKPVSAAKAKSQKPSSKASKESNGKKLTGTNS